MEEEHMREPLLEKKQYYEDCPGCKVEQANELNEGVSIIKLLIIWMVVLSATLPTSSLFPFLYFMVRDFNIAEEEADISYYAGYIGSSYMLGRCFTAVLWGMVSDRYGRKPVLIMGIIAVVIFNTLFGLSTGFWMAIVTRFLLGGLNGVLGPVKAYATELFREEHQAIGLSTVSAAWGIGLIVGPAIGGYLAQPVDKYPNIFPKNSFWDKFPYFLPCFTISALALTVAIVCIWIPETLHNHNGSKESKGDAEALENGSSKEKTVQKNENLFLNWPLMSSIIAYCVVSLHDIAYQEVFSLWAVSPLRLGGLKFTTDDVGDVLSISGVALCIYQLFIYPYVEKACGPIVLARITGIFALFLRPNKDHKYRFYWNIYHYSFGYAIIILAIVNIFRGFDILNPEEKWKLAYIILIIALAVIALLLEAITWSVVLKRNRKNSNKTYDGYNNNGQNMQQPIHI